MALVKNVQDAFFIFISVNELGNSDVKKLNQVLEKLNDKAEVSKVEVIEVIAPKSKDKDANYRNFISRIKNALADAIENAKEERSKGILESITLDNLKATTTEEARLAFFAKMPRELPDTVRQNPNYNTENYVDSQGSSEDVMKYFISYATKDAKDANLFKERVEALTKNDDTFRQWNMIDLEVGEDFDERIKKELKECNYGIALVSNNFLKSQYIMEIELDDFLKKKNLIPVGLKGKMSTLLKIDKYKNAEELFKKELFVLKDRNGQDFFADCTTKEAQEDFVQKLINRIKKRVEVEKANPFQVECTDLNVLEVSRKSEYVHAHYTKSIGESQCIEDNLEKLASDLKKEPTLVTNKIAVQDDLYDWVHKRDEPLYAILGDYGMGKTFNCRIFAKKMQEENKEDANKMAVVYIDLRDVPTFVQENGISRQPYVEEIIDEVLRLSINEGYSAKEIIGKNKKGELLIIFDGLDEKLVHYSKDMQSKFLLELLNILEFNDANSPKQKVLLSCRNHYFENVSMQNSFLTGHGRSGLGARHYKSLNILPMEMDAIKELLHKQLKKYDADKLIVLIEDEEYLKGIASRPFMLNKLSSILPALIKLKEQGQELNTKTFYHALVEDTFKRDNEKHTLNIRHKKELLIALAMELHVRGEQKLDIDELNDWFNQFIMKNEKFKIYLQDNDSLEILERDLRNSTLLVRFGESDFGFSHSSIYEYFLSEYILKNWEKVETTSQFSNLTEQFVLEGVELFSKKDKKTLGTKITKTLALENSLSITKLALQLASKLELKLVKILLEDLDLENFEFNKLECENFEIISSNLYNTSFLNCKIGKMTILNSNLGNSIFQNSKILNIKTNTSLLEDITSYKSELNWQKKPKNHHDFLNLSKNKIFDNFQLGDNNNIKHIEYTNDGKNIITVSQTHEVMTWNLNGECIESDKRLDGWDEYITFNQGNIAYVEESTVFIVNSQNDYVHEIKEEFSISKLVYSRDGKYLAYYVTGDEVIKVFNVQEKCIEITIKNKDIDTLTFNPITNHLVGSLDEGGIITWNHDGEIVEEINNIDINISNFIYSNNGKYLACTTWDNSIVIFDGLGNKIQTLKIEEGHISVISFSHDNKYLTGAFFNGMIKIWDLDGQCIKTFGAFHVRNITASTYSFDNKSIFSNSNDNTIKVWNSNGEQIRCLSSHTHSVSSLSLNPNTKYLISASDDGVMKTWDEEKVCIHTFKKSSHNRNFVLAYSKNNKYLAIASGRSNDIEVWTNEGKKHMLLAGHSKYVENLTYNMDNGNLASTSWDKTIKIWNKDGDCIQTLEGHDDAVCGLIYGSNYKYLVSSSWDGTIKFWDKEGKCMETLLAHPNRVRDIVYSPDAKYLFSCSDDKTIKVWNNENICVKSIECGYRVWSLSCSSDGKYIVAGTYEGVMLIIDIQKGIVSKILMSNKNEWCSFDMESKVIKGTANAWKFATLSYRNNFFKMDEYEGFELFDYE